jgi:hypothetical protein
MVSETLDFYPQVTRLVAREDFINKLDIWEIRFGGVDWIHLAQGRDRWWALVNTTMNFCVP